MYGSSRCTGKVKKAVTSQPVLHIQLSVTTVSGCLLGSAYYKHCGHIHLLRCSLSYQRRGRKATAETACKNTAQVRTRSRGCSAGNNFTVPGGWSRPALATLRASTPGPLICLPFEATAGRLVRTVNYACVTHMKRLRRLHREVGWSRRNNPHERREPLV